MSKTLRWMLLWMVGIAPWFMMAHASAGEGDLECRVGTGAWDVQGQGVRLLGALCASDKGCGDFYSFDFGTGSITYAQRFSDMDACGLRFLLQSGQTLFYCDEKRVYGLDSETLKLRWLGAVGEVQAYLQDPDKANQFALLVEREEGRHVLVLRVKPSGVDIVLEARVEGAQRIVWQGARLVAFGDEALYWWQREGDGFGDLESVEIKPALVEGNYQMDEAGLMVISTQEPRVVYYRFGTADRTVARINATATVRAIGGSPEMAMVLTTDMYVTRMVARFGNVLQNRYEIKYWDLPKDTQERLFLAYGDRLVLGGARSGQAAMSVATDDITWKRRAVLSMDGPQHRLAYMDEKSLTTLNLGGVGTSPVQRRDLLTGELVASLTEESLAVLRGTGSEQEAKQGSAFGSIERVERLFDGSQFDLLYDDGGRVSLMRSRDMRVWPKVFVPPKDSGMQPGDLARNLGIQEFDNGVAAAAQVVDGKTSEWFVIQGDTQKLWSASDLHKQSQIKDALTAYEKWYGYCVDEKTCLISPNNEGTLQGTDEPFMQTLQSANHHKPGWMAYFMAIAALLASLLIPMWRSGTGKRGKVRVLDEEGEHASNNMLLLDQRGRRFVTERDKSRFLHRSILSTFIIRLSASVLIGLIVGLAISYRYYFDDSFSIFITWLCIIGVPVGAFFWIVLSWNYWNRHYLLRFGRATEGVWFDSATPEQAICYAPQEGHSYKLKRGQWKKVDFVPIILFDPERPYFALQYTGDGSFPLIPKLALSSERKAAWTRDGVKELVVLLLLGLCVGMTQFAYHRAFPNPLSMWDMNRLEARAVEEQSDFVVPCLESCFSSDEACKLQCHQRQLRLILKDSGVALQDEPALSPKSVLEIQHNAAQKVDTIIATRTEDCSALASQIRNVPLWTQSLAQGFWRVYAKKSIFESADLRALDETLRHKAESIQQLCQNDKQCAFKTNSCPAPPSCTGNVAVLKDALCAFGRSIVRASAEN